MNWGDDYGVRTDYYKSDPAYTWYERQAKRMGRKLNLSHLSDTECRQILDVIQRDYQIRQKEKQRLSKLSKEVHEEEQKRVVLSRQQEFNEKYCICCFASFGLIFRKRIKCSNCEFFACKDCMAKVEEAAKDKDATIPATMCIGCMQQRELQVQACEWFYGQIKSRFRRFGSAKVVRSLYKRNSEGSDSDGAQSNSDSGLDQQLSPPPVSFATPDDPSVVFMGQQGFVLVSNKQTNTEPSWKYSPSAAHTASIGTQAPQDANSQDLYSRLHPEGEGEVEGPIDAAYAEDVASARIVNLGDEEDGARAVIEQLRRTGMDDEMDGMELGDEEDCNNFRMRRKRGHPDVVVMGPNGDDSSRKVKFDETPHIVRPEDGDKLHTSSIPYHILSPNDDMSSSECSDRRDDTKVKGHRSGVNHRMSGDGADKDDDNDSLHSERNCGTYYPSDANYQEGAEGLSPRDFDSGIHMSYCLSLDDGKDSEHIRSSSQECLLSPESRKPKGLIHSRNSDSLDSFSSISIHSLDANDTVDSLETHYNSGHSEMNSPDINEDFESGASTLVGREERVSDDEEECNSVEIETMSLSRSSSEETLKTENEEDEREQELILADFLDHLHDRSSSMSSNEARSNDNEDFGSHFDRDNNLDLSQFVPNGAKNRAKESSRMLHRCNSQPEFNSMEDVTSFEEHKQRETRSYHSKSHKSKNAYKRSKSSDDFRYSHHRQPEERDFRHLPLGNMTEDAEAGDTIGDIQQMEEKTSPTNRFIRYDSLPLVVEVCEAEYTSPTHHHHHVSDFRRLSIEYGSHYDTEASERSRKHRNRRMDWQRKATAKNSYEENEARQPSLESTTTEDTLPKSTSLSSGPTTPESDKWRRDSQALVSSEAESFSDSAKDHQKSPEKDIGCDRVPSSADVVDSDVRKDEVPDNRMTEKELEDSNETENKIDELVRPSGKTKLTRSNRAVDEDTTEKGVATEEVVPKDEISQCGEESECSKSSTPPPSNSPSEQPSSNSPVTSPETSQQSNQRPSPRTSPANCRRKENLEIANLTKKVSMKQEEVLHSAEEVLSSANQLSDIQACVEELECRMDTLEKSVVGSFSGESGSDEEEPSTQDALSPQEQVAEDVQILEKQLAKAQQVDRQTEENSAVAVRLITATALKVLSTTENIIESEHAHWSASSVRPDMDSDDDKEESHHSENDDHSDKSDDVVVSESASKTQEAGVDEVLPRDNIDEGEDHEFAAMEKASEEMMMMTSVRPSTEGMHLDLDGTEKREPTSDGADISPSFQGAHCPSPEAQRSSSRQPSYDPYGGTGCSILHIEPQEGALPTATLMCDTEEDVQNGNGLGATYETPTASSRPPVPSVRCLPTGSSQEDEDVEEKRDSPRASPVGQEDAVQAALYEDIAELEEKVYLSAGKVFTLEERLQQLENQVDKIDRCSPEDTISDLEDSLALTMAQVAQSESQVMSVEEQIAMLSQSRPIYSSTQVIDCPAKGSTPPHHHGVSLATLNLDPSGSPFRLGVVQIEISKNCLEAVMEEENNKEDTPQDGAVQTAPFDDVIVRHTTGDHEVNAPNGAVEEEIQDRESVDENSQDGADGEEKKFTSVRKRVALFEMHISESGSSTELEPKSLTMGDSTSTETQTPEQVQTQAKLVS